MILATLTYVTVLVCAVVYFASDKWDALALAVAGSTLIGLHLNFGVGMGVFLVASAVVSSIVRLR
jgi:hypothetical protein